MCIAKITKNTATLSSFNVSRFEADDNAILDCSLTCFDGTEDLHNQDGKLVIITLVDDVVILPIFGLNTKARYIRA